MWQLSVSTNPDIPSPYHNRYKQVELPLGKTLGLVILNYVWAPIVWRDGARKSANFIRSDLLVLDFDNGKWSLDDARAFCKQWDYAHIVGTTRSHTAEAHRFRLIIPWETPISDLEAYKQNMQRIAQKLPADTQALDAARCYKPCREIIVMQDGRSMPWRAYKPPEKRRECEYREKGVLPPWLRAMLELPPPQGLRNRHAFKLAAKLAEHGFSEQQVVDAVCAAPIDLPKGDKICAARSGYANRRR